MPIIATCLSFLCTYMIFMSWVNVIMQARLLLLRLQSASVCHKRLIAFAAAQAVDTWLKGLENVEQRSLLKSMFDKYVSSTMTYCSKSFRSMTPNLAVSEALTICKLLEGLLRQVCLIAESSHHPSMCSIIGPHEKERVLWAPWAALLKKMRRPQLMWSMYVIVIHYEYGPMLRVFKVT